MTMNNFIFENSTKVFFGKGCVMLMSILNLPILPI